MYVFRLKPLACLGVLLVVLGLTGLSVAYLAYLEGSARGTDSLWLQFVNRPPQTGLPHTETLPPPSAAPLGPVAVSELPVASRAALSAQTPAARVVASRPEGAGVVNRPPASVEPAHVGPPAQAPASGFATVSSGGGGQASSIPVPVQNAPHSTTGFPSTTGTTTPFPGNDKAVVTSNGTSSATATVTPVTPTPTPTPVASPPAQKHDQDAQQAEQNHKRGDHLGVDQKGQRHST